MLLLNTLYTISNKRPDVKQTCKLTIILRESVAVRVPLVRKILLFQA
jgi:hypothetical protein